MLTLHRKHPPEGPNKKNPRTFGKGTIVCPHTSLNRQHYMYTDLTIKLDVYHFPIIGTVRRGADALNALLHGKHRVNPHPGPEAHLQTRKLVQLLLATTHFWPIGTSRMGRRSAQTLVVTIRPRGPCRGSGHASRW